jgi:hypothetical protein
MHVAKKDPVDIGSASVRGINFFLRDIFLLKNKFLGRYRPGNRSKDYADGC